MIIINSDGNRFGRCNGFNILISMGAPEQYAYEETGLIFYPDQCSRINDLTENSLINENDKLRLQKYTRFQDLPGMGATNEQAEEIIGIKFVPT